MDGHKRIGKVILSLEQKMAPTTLDIFQSNRYFKVNM